MIRTFALACAGLGLALISQPALADEALSYAELRQLFPGTFTAVVKGYTVQISAKGNGVLVGNMNGLKDSGRWSLEGGKLCIMMSSWTGGRSNCSEVVAENGWYRGQGVRFRKL